MRRRIGQIMVGASLLLLLFTAFCFWRQPEKLAAFTVVPIWLWGAIGLHLTGFAWYFLDARFSRRVSALWLVLLLFGADEARVLLHLGKTPPLPGAAAPYRGEPVLRVLTLNCRSFYHGDPSADIAAWQPDIVLLQEILPVQARHVAQVLYGDGGEFLTYRANAIVTRWKFKREILSRPQRDQHATLLLPDGREIEIVNLHLASAATDLRLFRKIAWEDHRNNRLNRQNELAATRGVLAATTAFPKVPVLLGGDFNAPANDVVYRQLAPDFTDAFSAAGTGWGDTFHRRLPILRIDHIFTTRHLTAVRSRVAVTVHSDHRMVVADFRFPPATPE